MSNAEKYPADLLFSSDHDWARVAEFRELPLYPGLGYAHAVTGGASG